MILGVAAVCSVGCGGGLSTDLEGIYNISTWTKNTTACDAEGASILDQQGEKSLYIEPQSIFGTEFINAVTCADLADCKMKRDSSTIELGGWTFEHGSDDKGWTGATVFAGVNGSECQGTYIAHRMTPMGASGMRIESRTQETAPFPTDSDGFCNTDKAEAAAAGMPCVTLEVVTGTIVE